MRTRRSRGLRQTRKGGNPEDNRKNWEMYWSDAPYNPYTKYPKGVQGKFYGTLTPTVSKELNMNKTYIIQRHGFSCANLQKVKDKKQNEGKWYAKFNPSLHGRVEDPSLTAYGIYSLLRKEEKHPAFKGTVFGSSLLRTWQTALLIYGKFGPVRIIVSPYIKEKHGMMLDLSNMPLPFEQQMEQMGQFMEFLAEIDNDIAREIIRHEHIIQYDGNDYPVGPYQPQATRKVTTQLPKQSAQEVYQQLLRGDPQPPPSPPEYNYAPQDDYLESFKAYVKTDTVSKETPIKKNGYIPAITVIPEPSFREYYGAEGFVYFDRWVSKKIPKATTIFVVSHSKWMQKVIQEYCGTVETNIFDENAWKLIITPNLVRTGAGVTFEIIPGLPKPTYEELDHMNRAQEPTCNVVPRPRTMPPSRPPPQREPLPLPRPETYNVDFAKQFAEENDPNPLLPVRLTEVTTVPIESTSVTTEPKFDITRSFTELLYMLSNPGIAQSLSLLVESPKELKTKVLQFVYSNPNVTESKGFFSKPKSLYLLQNHYFAFILMYNPYYESLVENISADVLAQFKITSPDAIIRFLKELRILIDTDVELYQALLYAFKANANNPYLFEAPPKVYAFTLLDLLLYEMLPLTAEKIKLMYPLFIDLVRNGARFSKVIYSDIAESRKMPRSELKQLNEVEQFALKEQWEEATRRLDPTNELSQLNEQFRQAKRKLESLNGKVNKSTQQSAILDELDVIKKRYRETSIRLDPNQELSKLRGAYRNKINEGVYVYLFDHLIQYVPVEDFPARQAHNDMLRKIAGSLGGSRGTSWKKSLLRQSSVKAGRYRASLYKGKRRTRANRS